MAVISVSFRWISGCCFLESFEHCAGVLLVLFPKSDSVSDSDTLGEVSLTGDVCDSKSFLRFLLVVEILCNLKNRPAGVAAGQLPGLVEV